jgi:hypothetical protein
MSAINSEPSKAWEQHAAENPEDAGSQYAHEMFLKGWAARSMAEHEIDLQLGDAQQQVQQLLKEISTGCPINDQVIDKIKARARKGIEKFGGNMMQSERPVVEWLNEAQEEAMDTAVYIQRIIISLAQEQSKKGR